MCCVSVLQCQVSNSAQEQQEVALLAPHTMAVTSPSEGLLELMMLRRLNSSDSQVRSAAALCVATRTADGRRRDEHDEQGVLHGSSSLRPVDRRTSGSGPVGAIEKWWLVQGLFFNLNVGSLECAVSLELMRTILFLRVCTVDGT